jgi:hypothetical protein
MNRKQSSMHPSGIVWSVFLQSYQMPHEATIKLNKLHCLKKSLRLTTYRLLENKSFITKLST